MSFEFMPRGKNKPVEEYTEKTENDLRDIGQCQLEHVSKIIEELERTEPRREELLVDG